MRRLLLTALLGLVLTASACGGGGTSPAPAPTTESTAPAPTTESTVPADTAVPAIVARAAGELAVYATPGATSPAQILPATTELGSPRALLVVDHDDDWLEVTLPVRPNGSTGWIRRTDVDLRQVDVAIDIDLTARTLVVHGADGETVLSTPVAIGSGESPTPTGSFSVIDRVETQNPNGAYGPFALGLSGHSDVLTEFAGGDGQIGIHGTNDPSSIGQAVSHGCIRVPNDVAAQLNDLVPLGTPVTIR